jgi:UPF0755 protein
MSEPTPSHTDLRSVAQRTSQRGSRILSGFLFFTLLFLGVVFVWLPYVLNEPPQDFPTGKLIVIDEGLTQDAVTKLLQEENVVRSSLYLYILLRTQYADAYVQAGTYQFDTRKTTEEIAYAVMTGEESAPLLRFTLPEGFHARDLGMYLPKELDIETGADIQTLEGTLFPDTYFIRRDTTLIDIVTLLQSTMEEKIAPLRGAIEASGFTEDEVIILASILEREANDEISKKMVSGILQNRLRIGMALQVDATLSPREDEC